MQLRKWNRAMYVLRQYTAEQVVSSAGLNKEIGRT